MKANFINMEDSRIMVHTNNGIELRMIDDKTGNIVYRHLTKEECLKMMDWIKTQLDLNKD